MPNKNTYTLFLYFLLLNSALVCSQTKTVDTNKEAIASAFEHYFELDRESIHVQMDKNVFMTNEAIWFKGYVYNTKSSLPFYATTNVYVQLINESGTIVANQLLYAMSGVFAGKINLDKQAKSGYYYLQFYTNWMNNFEEDESYVQRIKIISSAGNNIPIAELVNPAKIKVEFYPEGGNLITDVSNTIGVKVTDINGKAISDCTLEIHDKNDTVQKSVVINSFGMGKFDYIPNAENYKAVVRYHNSEFEYALPVSNTYGISLELNNYIFENKTLVKIKYNKDYWKNLKNNLMYLVIQKNEKTNIIDFKLDSDTGTKEFFFSNASLFTGVNSIRIIDTEQNEIAQRLLFVSEEKSTKSTINTGIKNDKKVEFSGSSNWGDACVSVSVLPSNTKLDLNENIITSLTLNAFLNEKVTVKSDYFNEINRSKKHELDLMLLTQKNNKYDWNKIKRYVPSEPRYNFEQGLDVKGSINSTTADLKKCRLQLKNVLGDVLSSTEIVTKDGFLLKNTSVTDSLMVTCDLIDAKDRSKKDMTYYLTIVNKQKKYNKNYLPVAYVFPEKNGTDISEDIQIPYFNGMSIVLDEVAIKKEKSRLKRGNQSGNAMLRGYKVGVDIPENNNVLEFIAQNGFNVSNSAGEVTITGRTMNSINMEQFSKPAVFLDGRELRYYDELIGMRISELDEIYISTTAMVPSILNYMGIIRMYRKQPDYSVPDPKNKPRMIIGGFEPILAFENADYASEKTIGFENLGLVFWAPWILTDGNNNVRFAIPNNHHKKVKLLMEGFTYDGKLISEVKEVNLEE